MSDVMRYNQRQIESGSGEWVRYDDHVAALAEANEASCAEVEAERDAERKRAERLRRLVIPPLRQLYGATILVREPPFMPTPEMLGERKTATEYQAWRTAYAVVLELAQALAAESDATERK